MKQKELMRLRDILLLGNMENVYLTHDAVDVGFVPAIVDGLEGHSALMNAPIKEIRLGAYGPEIVLTEIDPQLLVDFDRAMTSSSNEQTYSQEME